MAAPFTEGQAQRALAQFFDWASGKKVFINAFLFDWEMDCCVVTDSGYIWEVEVKCTLADWKADVDKDKWKSKHIDKVSRLYYAVPWTLVDKVPDFVKDHVGLITLHVNAEGNGLYAKLHREAKSKRGYTLTYEKEIQLYRSTYFKYWGKISPAESKEEQACYIDLETDSEASSPSWQGPSPISPPVGKKPAPKPQSKPLPKPGVWTADNPTAEPAKANRTLPKPLANWG